MEQGKARGPHSTSWPLPSWTYDGALTPLKVQIWCLTKYPNAGSHARSQKFSVGWPDSPPYILPNHPPLGSVSDLACGCLDESASGGVQTAPSKQEKYLRTFCAISRLDVDFIVRLSDRGSC